MNLWIDEFERDLGQAARLALIANAGGQRRDVPLPENAAASALAGEIGLAAAIWLADRFGGIQIDVPSRRGSDRQRQASLLRAAILDAGLTNPIRSANDLASQFGVTSMWVRKLRAEMRAEANADLQLRLF